MDNVPVAHRRAPHASKAWRTSRTNTRFSSLGLESYPHSHLEDAAVVQRIRNAAERRRGIISLGLIKLGSIGQIVGFTAEQHDRISPAPLLRDSGIHVGDRSFAKGVPAERSASLTRLDVRKLVAAQDKWSGIRITDGRAQNRRIHYVGPIAGGAVDVAESRRIGTYVQRERCPLFPESRS